MCMIKKRMKARLILFFLTFLPIVVLAATGGDTNVSVPHQHKEYIDMFKWGLGIVLAGQFFWIQKYMRDNEKKHDGHESGLRSIQTRQNEVNREQWEAIGNLAQSLNQLVGEHRAMHSGATTHRATDPPEIDFTKVRTHHGERQDDRGEQS